MDVGGDTGHAKSEPNVVPLCDILLVLLIIFMIIIPVTQKGIDIKLPEPNPDPGPQPPSRMIVLNLKKDGIFINQESVPRELLRGRLKEIFDIRADKTAFLKAEPTVKFGEVVRVMDIAKGAGVDTIGIITEKAAPPAAAAPAPAASPN